MNLPKKKRIEEIDRSRLQEPALDQSQQRDLANGIALFHEGRFWEAHESWEEVWKGCADESRIFFQGIIQAAAAYHLLISRRRYLGAMNNFDKALSKLELFPDRFLGIEVRNLCAAITESKQIAARLGPQRLAEFPETKIPRLTGSS